MEWSMYLVFPDDSDYYFDPKYVHWKDRPAPTLIAKVGRFKDLKGNTVQFKKCFDLSDYPCIGKLLAGSISNRVNKFQYDLIEGKSVESINVFLDTINKKQIGMTIHKLFTGGNRSYTAAAISYYDTSYSYQAKTLVNLDGSYFTPPTLDREGLINVRTGSLPNLSDFGYETRNTDESDFIILDELENVDKFNQDYLDDYYEYVNLENELIPTAAKPVALDERIIEIITKVDNSIKLLEKVDGALSSLDVSNPDTGNLGELITECKDGIEESLRKLTEQSSELESISGTLGNVNDNIENTLSNSMSDFSARLSTISEFYGTRIFEIDELKAELSSFYDKAIAAWKESIESISESLTASAQAGSVALDINQALDSLKSNLKRVETLASIFDKASTVSGEISTNAQIVGTAVSTLSSLLLSFNNSVDSYEKTLLSLVENVRQNLDLFLHSSDSVFREARKAVSDSVVTNALSKGLDLINSIKKKETL